VAKQTVKRWLAFASGDHSVAISTGHLTFTVCGHDWWFAKVGAAGVAAEVHLNPANLDGQARQRDALIHSTHPQTTSLGMTVLSTDLKSTR